MSDDPFARRLLVWFDRHGRKNLPWQQDPTPYRVWVSEIMLQQTQVKTVLGYYERFMKRFPDVQALSEAPLDDVLHEWSGLGYYARARNMHRAAEQVCREYGGVFPDDIDVLQQLPGIGRSTAGAILSLACNQRHPILDGNVKRVLCRFHGIEGWPGRSEVANELWDLAESHTPYERVAEYTQAIMDLGATLCTRSRPGCLLCPGQDSCTGRRLGIVERLPARKPKAVLPERDTVFAIVRDPDGSVLLERRPPVGVWGGLWGFPECSTDTDMRAWCEDVMGAPALAVVKLKPIRHGFTHFHLDIQPVLIDVNAVAEGAMEADGTLWYNTASPPSCGLAAPVSALLAQIAKLPARNELI